MARLADAKQYAPSPPKKGGGQRYDNKQMFNIVKVWI